MHPCASSHRVPFRSDELDPGDGILPNFLGFLPNFRSFALLYTEKEGETFKKT